MSFPEADGVFPSQTRETHTVTREEKAQTQGCMYDTRRNTIESESCSSSRRPSFCWEEIPFGWKILLERKILFGRKIVFKRHNFYACSASNSANFISSANFPFQHERQQLIWLRKRRTYRQESKMSFLVELGWSASFNFPGSLWGTDPSEKSLMEGITWHFPVFQVTVSLVPTSHTKAGFHLPQGLF